MSVPLQIRPQKPIRGGLESVATPLPMTEEDWRTGVQIQTVCGLEPFVWGCASVTDPEDPDTWKPVADILPYSEFSSTMIGLEVACGPNGPNSPIGDIAKRIAQEGLERVRFSRLAQVLANGDVGGGATAGFGTNPSLQEDSSNPDGFVLATPAGILTTIQGLLDAVTDCWQTDVVFHVPLSFLPHFLDNHLVEWDAERGVWHMGPYEFSFDLYPNLGSAADELATPTATDGSEVWIYVTSRPLYAFSREMTIAARKQRLNEYVVEALRGAIIVFDPCCAMGAKAQVCDEVCA